MILHLLAKDPGKRPESAAAALAVLETVDPSQKSATHSDSNVLDRLARGVFVGREKELDRLRKAFDEAFAGRGGLVMLVGEPGIGKTRTAQELETYARMRGAQVLWGASHEASGAPPFYPFIQVGRHWGQANANDLSVLTPLMASGGGDLVRLFPELRQLVPPGFVEPPAVTEAASAQFRLFEAYTSFIAAISGRQPTVVTLDDLHWADKPTLQLLQHLARSLARMRVLVVCTYRDTDITRQSSLSETLAALNREPGFQRVVLRGLSKEEVRAYISGAAHVEPTPGVLERIFEETEGNPFFLAEVVNLLTREGTLSKDSVSDIAVPDGVKEALGRRLDRLSPEANELLQICAVVGREFAYDTLTLLGDRDEGALLRLVEEGLEARVIEEMDQPGRYRFTHALMQETLLGELSATRRVRLHGQVGEALERRWGDRADEYASRLALHFGESATLTPSHEEKARRYALAAARQAEAQFAWAEAARLYEAATDGVDNPDPATLAALANCQDTASAFQGLGAVTRRRALTGYRARGDSGGFARTVADAPPIAAALQGGEWAALLREAVAGAGGLDRGLNLKLRRRLRLHLEQFVQGTTEAELRELEREIYDLASDDSLLEAVAVRREIESQQARRKGGLVESALAAQASGRAFAAIGSDADAFPQLLAAAAGALMGGSLGVAAEAAEELLAFGRSRRDPAALTFAPGRFSRPSPHCDGTRRHR